MADLFEETFQTNAYLVSKDAKGKVRCVRIWYEWSDSAHAYLLKRQSWQLNGKRIDHPDIPIKKGLMSRTLREQTQLQFNSKLKEYKDKGYKEVEEDPDTKTESAILDFLPEFITDNNEHIKPMLAKQEKKVTKREIFEDNVWLASRKINGLRCLYYWDGKYIKTYSRGGEDYNLSTQHLTKNKELIKIFKKFPTLVLDTELYKHGKSLQQISGAARMEKNAYDCDWLEMYCYDCFFTDRMHVNAMQRQLFLKAILEPLGVGFDPNKQWKEDELQIQLVPQIKVKGWENIEKLHNEYVSEGFEGVVLRDPTKPYKPNSRGNQMIKVKHYLDETYRVIDYELGLRGSEDMVFVMQMNDGRTFKASPMGDRATKQDYVDRFDECYKNHLGDCKYFEYSDTGIPCQPKFSVFRFDLE